MTFPHGMEYGCDPQSAFRALWDSLNKDRGFGWAENPWVAAYTFEVVKQNIDQMEAPCSFRAEHVYNTCTTCGADDVKACKHPNGGSK